MRSLFYPHFVTRTRRNNSAITAIPFNLMLAEKKNGNEKKERQLSMYEVNKKERTQNEKMELSNTQRTRSKDVKP